MSILGSGIIDTASIAGPARAGLNVAAAFTIALRTCSFPDAASRAFSPLPGFAVAPPVRKETEYSNDRLHVVSCLHANQLRGSWLTHSGSPSRSQVLCIPSCLQLLPAGVVRPAFCADQDLPLKGGPGPDLLGRTAGFAARVGIALGPPVPVGRRMSSAAAPADATVPIMQVHGRGGANPFHRREAHVPFIRRVTDHRAAEAFAAVPVVLSGHKGATVAAVACIGPPMVPEQEAAQRGGFQRVPGTDAPVAQGAEKSILAEMMPKNRARGRPEPVGDSMEKIQHPRVSSRSIQRPTRSAPCYGLLAPAACSTSRAFSRSSSRTRS